MEIQIGDDITVSGKVKRIENGCIMIKTKNGSEMWIEPKDVRTHRPMRREKIDKQGDLKIWNKEKSMSDICAVCQFCTYEDERPPEAYCHNQYSGNYGKLLKHADIEKPGCIDFSPHIYKSLSLKEALRILTTETVGHNAYYKLPRTEENLPPFLCINFDGNSQMARWRDAHTRLFMEYMKMAKKDGDFTDDSTKK